MLHRSTSDDTVGKRIEHDGAVDLPLARRMLGNVGYPKPVALAALELPIDQIAGGRHVGDTAVPRPPGCTLDACAAHQHLHRLMADLDPAPEPQLCMHPPRPVDATVVGVNPPDDLCQPPWRSIRGDGGRFRHS